jgi:UDP-N-acetylmuramoyl-tripeptide--D-alanyl-D-alanine ligase
MGTIEAIAAAKAELIAGLRPHATAIVPAGEPLLEPHLRADLRTLTFGPGGDVQLTAQDNDQVTIDCAGETVTLEVPFTQAHLRQNLLAVVAAAKAIRVHPQGKVDLVLSAGRGQRIDLPSGITLLDDSYNANPVSMRAALDYLDATVPSAPEGRRIAVLGDMLELGPDESHFHEEIGRYARARAVDLLIAVGPLSTATAAAFDHALTAPDAASAAALLHEVARPGDVVLVKASRGVGLELVCQALVGETR